MAVKFPLKMPDGTAVRTIEELREHFDLRTVLDYYSSGRLKEWLEERYYDEEAQKVGKLDLASEKFKEELCAILGVPYMERMDTRIDVGDIVKKNERRERLKKYTTDDTILASADNVAFTQKELAGLLKRLDSLEVDDEGNRVIYLCGEHFIIPAKVSGVIYRGVNNPTVKFDADVIESGIDLQNVICDVSDYVADGNYGAFFEAFDNNLLLGAKLLRQVAEKGNVDAQFVLGECYRNGFGVEEDWEEAGNWIQKAAEQGHVDANVINDTVFHVIVYDGEAAREAVKWFKKAVEQDSLYAGIAEMKLGECYVLGMGVEQDFKEAVKFLKRAVRRDNVDAKTQYYLGCCYYNGEGVEQNYIEAVKWFQEAAEQGVAEAQRQLAICYTCGIGVGQNDKEAVKWYMKAAEQGDEIAQCRLAFCYQDGKGIEQNDEEAVGWFRKAAKQGSITAQQILGNLYMGIDGVEPNFLEAVKWRRRAAEQGDEDAQKDLERCCDSYITINGELKLVECYRKATEQNDAEAQCYLGSCYENGRGTEIDIDEAREWYSKAAEQGNADANAGFYRCCSAGLSGIIQNFGEFLKSYGEDEGE